MQVKVLKLGMLETNCYILKLDDKVIVIDPADEADKIINYIGDDKLIKIFVTHNHFDHIGALDELKKHYNVEVYDRNNLSEKEYNIEGFKFKVIFTPGHTTDSITLYFEKEKIMFVGDFIFKDSIGRTDLGGNMEIMKKSIDKIKKYSDVLIYPGHGDITYLDYEKKYNYYFK